jgi:RNA polymerase sigma factor (sigma-70 family)
VAFIRKISSNHHSDNELIDQYKRTEDLQILGTLFYRYMDLTYGVCLKYLKQPENAQDAVMSIFEELIGKLKKHEIENFRPWLYTLAKNYCLMKLRTDKKAPILRTEEELMQFSGNWHLNDAPGKEDSFKLLENCLGQLISEQRKVIELFYFQNKCYNEITELTGMDWNKVRSYIQNGRRNLKICIEKEKAKQEV